MFQKFAFVALSVALFLPAVLFAQQHPGLPCGTDKMVKELMLRNPDYARQIKERRELMRNMAERPETEQRRQNSVVIPVVVHIIHDYNNGNISREQVMDAMRILNEDFNAGSSDLPDVIAPFSSIVGNVGIEFRLAKLDPNGNCTDGITRTYSPLTNSANDNIKNLIRWNPQKYLNIWVVKTISFGAGGYAYYPCPGSGIDGIVVIASQFGSIGASSSSTLFRSITHEVGHYLDLPHTWGDSNDPGLPSNCSDDDGISDTPNTIGVSNFSCNTSQNTCGSLDNVQNIMDYSACQIMFTQGQKNRMIDALTFSCRSTLITPANLSSTGTNNGFVAGPCAPVADFNAFVRTICEGSSVTFQELSYNGEPDTATWTWNWSFPGGTPASSTEQNPTVIYNTPGNYPVSLTVSAPGGTNTRTKNSYIEVRAVQTGLTAPFSESFEASTFPAHPSDPLLNWVLESPTSSTWERTSDASVSGDFSMRIRHQLIPSGRENSFITPNIDFTGVSQPKVYFKVAYNHSSGSGTDRLLVYYSSDCGQSWGLRYAKAGTALATAPAAGGNFVPATDQWRQETVQLPNGFDHMMLKFTSSSGNGGSIYVDDINVAQLPSSTEDELNSALLQVYPNPNNGNATIRFSTGHTGNSRISIINSIGQEVGSKVWAHHNGNQEADLNFITGRNLPGGVYTIRLQTNARVITQKLIVN